MADVFIHKLGAPKKFRNKRVYGGYSFQTTNLFETQNTATIHREFGTLLGDTDIISKDINITFGQEFLLEPVGWFEIYRMVARDGEYAKQNVLCTHTNEEWLTTTGFQITIHSSESLTGVILKYYYTE